MGIDESKLRKNEKWENLTISNDFMFSKVMQDKEICKETLEILLDKKIGNIKYVETQKVIDIGHDEKSVRLDAYVEDEEILYDIEMQVVKDTDISERSRFYQVIMDADSLNKGDAYGDLKKNIIIFICKFDPFGDELHRYTFMNICVENRKRFLNDGTSKIFFNTKEYNKEQKESIKLLLEYIEKNRVSDNEFIKKLHKKIEKIKKNKDWRLEYMTILMNERQIAKSNYIKGKQEGIEVGKREGIEEGKREGIEEGKREGIEEGIKKLVLLCKEFNMEHKEIVLKLVEMYGLTEKEASKYLEN